MDNLKEHDNTLKKINALIIEHSGVSIIEDIIKNNDSYKGKIQVEYLNETLHFEIIVPNNYPLSHPNADNISIVFRNRDYIGFNHINPDGSVCFHPDKDDNFDRKFNYELLCLKQWIRDYYILKKDDDDFSYLIHRTEPKCINRLYFTNTNNNFKKNLYGTFNYSIFSNEKFGDGKYSVKKLFRLGFDNGNEDKWSETFTNQLKSRTCKKGIYYFIEEEPLNKDHLGRKGAESWEELEPYLTPEFKQFLYEGLKREFGKSYFHENSLYLLIGYKIPNRESYEDHWDLIRISKNNNPIECRRILKNERKDYSQIFEYNIKGNRINWASTENLDYSRFFGRGKLHETLTESRILIIGCGALGSSLAEILVRGGAKNLVLEDFDLIRGGNLCRANYDLNNMIFSKTDSLTNRLKSISPHVNLTTIPVKLNSYDLNLVQEVINRNIDIIFDCSTDPEVTFILDKIDFKGQIFSLAITNNAKSFVAVTGRYITRKAKTIFDFVENEPPSYFEGTGCGYPTFEANFNDINTLLNTGIKILNNNFLKGRKNECFIVTPNLDKSLDINIEEYEDFFCPLIESFILISKTALKNIKEETQHHYPKEYGGVFIGYKSNENYVITDVWIPDDFLNGKTVFVRHPGTLNQRLSEIHKISNGKIQYLGEWHSHPDGPTIPSNTDIIAMKEIAKDKKINVEKPLLMIAEIDKMSFDKDFYIYDNKKLKKYE